MTAEVRREAPDAARPERRPASLSRRLAMQAGLSTAGMVIGASLLVSAFTAFHQFYGTLAGARTTVELVLDTLGPVGPTTATYTAVADNSSKNDPHIWIFRNGQMILESPNTGFRPPTGPRGVTLRLRPVPYLRVYRTRQNLAVLLDMPLSPTIGLIGDLLLGVFTIGLAAAAGGGAFGYLTARRMLWPVQSLTRAAAQLHRQADGARLPVLSAADDEISRLGRVLNDLIADVEAQRQRDRAMLAEAAHQLRTPLQIVQGNAALLAQHGRLGEQEAQESLRAIEAAVSGMTELTNDLLTLESARSSRPEPRTLQLRPWLESLAEDARALAPSLAIEVDPVLHAEVSCDEQLLARAYWALLENALHYTPHGGLVTLGASAVEGVVRIYVRDNGPGIPADELPFVSERFYRGRLGRRQSGTGLGLAIGKALAESMGGQLTLESAGSGSGTTAAIVLPSA